MKIQHNRAYLFINIVTYTHMYMKYIYFIYYCCCHPVSDFKSNIFKASIFILSFSVFSLLSLRQSFASNIMNTPVRIYAQQQLMNLQATIFAEQSCNAKLLKLLIHDQRQHKSFKLNYRIYRVPIISYYIYILSTFV